MMSDAAFRSLRGLGGRMKEARLRRNWTQQQTAEKAGLSESSVKKVESGSPRITVGAYLSLLDVYGMPAAFDRTLAPGDDSLGEALARGNARQRAGGLRSSPREDDWEL